MILPDQNSVLCLPLGGCGQFGANITLYGFDGQWLAIDCGMGFADERLPGVDLLMPDVDFAAENKDLLKGLVITHAHEDHIGGVAYMWPRLECPIYVTPFAKTILERKFQEHNYPKKPKIIEINTAKFSVGNFEITPLPVTHSIPEARSIVVETALGKILHSGDWNLDPTPVIGEKTDENLFRNLGEVMAYVGDSTNAPISGHSKSEKDAAEGLLDAFKEARKRVVVTMFSSNISRLKSVCAAAEATGRRVCLTGRSLKSMADAAQQHGYLSDDVIFIDEKDAATLPKDKIVIVATGSQGESRAAVAKIASGSHQYLDVDAGDTVIFSARAIPGNERAINDIKNLMSAQGLHIIDPETSDGTIHVSGHPRRGEIVQMLDWVKPKSLIAVHGEKTMQHAQEEIAEELGIEFIHAPENGCVMEITPDGMKVIDHLEIAPYAYDMQRLVSTDHMPIAERRRMSFNGAVFVSVVLDKDTFEVLDLQMTPLGLLDLEEQDDARLLDRMVDRAVGALEDFDQGVLANPSEVESKLRSVIRKPFKEQFKMRPFVEIHVTHI